MLDASHLGGMQIDTLTISFEVVKSYVGAGRKKNNTVKLTLSELLCGFLGESLFIF